MQNEVDFIYVNDLNRKYHIFKTKLKIYILRLYQFSVQTYGIDLWNLFFTDSTVPNLPPN